MKYAICNEDLKIVSYADNMVDAVAKAGKHLHIARYSKLMRSWVLVP